MSVGKIKDLYPPGNNGSHPGSGRIAEDVTGNVYVFQTPKDLGVGVTVGVGTPVNFDVSNGNNVTNVRLALPACTLIASTTNPQVGQSLTLSWTSQNADSLSIDNGIGAVSPVALGSVVTTVLSGTTTYTLTATNSSGTATASVTVTATTGTGTGGGSK